MKKHILFRDNNQNLLNIVYACVFIAVELEACIYQNNTSMG